MALEYPWQMFERLHREKQIRELSEEEQATWRSLVDTVFFASLVLEEGEHVPVVVAYDVNGCSALSEMEDSDPTAFGLGGRRLTWRVTKFHRRDFNPKELVKLARGLKYGEHVVVVAGRANDMWIDGIARRIPGTSGALTLIVAPRPGTLIFQEAGQERLRFESGEQGPASLDVLRQDGPVRAAIASIAGSGVSPVSDGSWGFVLQELLIGMRSTAAGGMLILTPTKPSATLLEQQVKYRPEEVELLARAVSKYKLSAHRIIEQSHADDPDSSHEIEMNQVVENEHEIARQHLLDVIGDLSALSAIDGALLAGPGFAVYGAGYIVKASKESAPPVVREASNPAATETRMANRNLGARHNAAFVFASENPGSVVFVVSEDGPVRCVMRNVDGTGVIIWPVRLPEF